jgi:hypothetical protein
LATCELNGWGLSPNYKARDNSHSVAFWSNEQSGEDCIFTNTPTITLDFTEQYVTTGLTIQFALESYDYCRKLTVYWYQKGVVKEQEDYFPTSPIFITNKTVEAFDKLVFEFKETSLPRKRCKIESILMGVVRNFGETELTSVKAIHEVDLISNTVPVNVLDVSVHSRDEVDYIFQKKQPVEFTNNGDLIGVYYIDKGERTGRLNISFSCKDAIGLLDLVTVGGGLWFTDTPLQTVLNDVFAGAYEFDISPEYESATLRGYLEPGKKGREALQHIAFALGAIVDTTGTRKIRIFPPPTDAAEAISEKETYTGGKVKTSDTVTGLKLVAFEFTDDIPYSDSETIEYNGVEYPYTTEVFTATKPNTVTSDPVNIKTFDKCYLVNTSNAQTLVNNLMAYYQKRETYSFKHVLRGQKAANRYTAGLPWDGMASGHITKMTVTTSNITVADTEMLLDE